MFYVRMVVVLGLALFGLSSHASKNSESGGDSVSAEIVGLPSGIFFQADDKKLALMGDEYASVITAIDVKTGTPTNYRALFPRYLRVNNQPIRVSAVKDPDPQKLPQLLLRLPSASSEFTLNSFAFHTNDGSEYTASSVTIKPQRRMVRVFFHPHLTFENASQVASNSRVCLARRPNGSCVENSRIFAGSYYLRYKDGKGKVSRSGEVIFDKTCTEFYKDRSPVGELRERYKDKYVYVKCSMQDLEKSTDPSFGVVTYIEKTAPMVELITICSQAGCPIYTIGASVPIQSGKGKYTFYRQE